MALFTTNQNITHLIHSFQAYVIDKNKYHLNKYFTITADHSKFTAQNPATNTKKLTAAAPKQHTYLHTYRNLTT